MRTSTRRAVVAAVGVAALVTTVAATASIAAPNTSATGLTKAKTYVIHGYGYGDCRTRAYGDSTHTGVVKYFRTHGWSNAYTLGYYQGSGDARCDARFASATRATSLYKLGRALATYVYEHDTSKGRTVNLVGHSMGGLIIRTALAGVAGHARGFPSRLSVANAVTIDSPHQGVAPTSYWTSCAKADVQCREMSPKYTDYAFVRKLAHAPQGTGGTDWSVMGSTYDRTVSWRSGVDLDHAAQHKYHYLAGQPSGLSGTLGHGAIKYAAAHNRRYHLSYWKTGWASAKHTSKGWSPLYAVYQACLHPKGW